MERDKWMERDKYGVNVMKRRDKDYY